VVEIDTTIGNLKNTTILLYLHCLTTNCHKNCHKKAHLVVEIDTTVGNLILGVIYENNFLLFIEHSTWPGLFSVIFLSTKKARKFNGGQNKQTNKQPQQLRLCSLILHALSISVFSSSSSFRHEFIEQKNSLDWHCYFNDSCDNFLLVYNYGSSGQ
jgi:hypothetical protein